MSTHSVYVPREALRQMQALADRYMNQADALAGPGLPVGAAREDATMRCEAVWTYMHAIAAGRTPDEARTRALDDLSRWIRGHNALRPADIHWQRHAGRRLADGSEWDSPPSGVDAVDAAHGIASRWLVAAREVV